MPEAQLPTFTSSQGTAIVTGATKVTIKVTRNSSASTKLDASTLSLTTGANRVYESGITDNGQSGSTSALVVTVSVDGLGTKPTVGSIITAEGVSCKCMESTSDDSVGELKKWSASYTSDYVA